MDSTQSGIAPGAKVVSSDGKSVGTVLEVREDHVVVRQGTLLQHDLFIPIDHLSAGDGEARLSVEAADVDREGWRYPPSGGFERREPAYPEVPETTTIQAAGYSAGTLSAPEAQGFARDPDETDEALAHPDAPDAPADLDTGENTTGDSPR